MKIRKNDTVKVIAGKDRGKTGKVLKVYPEKNSIVVEGVNVLVKHVKAKKNGEKGQKIYFPSRIYTSKTMLVCPKCGKATRVSMSIGSKDLKQKKDRVCKKCTQSLSA